MTFFFTFVLSSGLRRMGKMKLINLMYFSTYCPNTYVHVDMKFVLPRKAMAIVLERSPTPYTIRGVP